MRCSVRLLLVLGQLWPPCATLKAQELNFDHELGTISMGADQFRSGDTIRLKDPATLVLVVTNTNTAGYSVKISSEPLAAPETAAIQGAGSAFGRLLPLLFAEMAEELSIAPQDDAPTSDFCGISVSDDLVKSLVGAKAAVLTTAAALRDVEDAVQASENALDAAVAALQGLRGADVTDGVRSEVKRLVERFYSKVTNTERYTFGRRSDFSTGLQALEEQLSHTRDLQARWNQRYVNQDDMISCLSEWLDWPAKSSAGLLESAKRLRSLTALERVATRLVAARGTWRSSDPEAASDMPKLSKTRGAKITLTITKEADPRLSALAPLRDRSFTMVVLPEWKVTPVLGVSLIVSPDSDFETYATRPTGNGLEQVIYANGSTDARYTYAVTLGLIFNRLQTESESFGIWPEIFVSPAGGIDAFGGGVAVTLFRYMKLGMGAMWTRHDELDGQVTGKS